MLVLLRGYNSEDYSYQYFTVTSDSNLGGGTYVDYSLKDYLDDTDVPGQVNRQLAGRVIPITTSQSLTKLKKNDFFV